MAANRIPERSSFAASITRFRSQLSSVIFTVMSSALANCRAVHTISSAFPLPYILSFAAGAMLYVVIEELIPESQNGDHSNIGTIGAALGFALMLILDVALG